MAIPTLVQHSTTSSTLSFGLALNGELRIRLPDKSQAGNCLVCAWKSEASATAAATVSDDKSNTWSQAVKHIDTVNGATCYVFIAVNCAADTREIRIKNTDATLANFAFAKVAEFNNIVTSSNANAIDVSAGTHGSSTTPQPGSFTPGTTGDLILHFAACDNGHATSYTAGSQSNITWQLLSADRQDGSAWQWGIYNSTSAINCSMTFGSSVGWCAVAVALKNATAGNARPAGIRVIGRHSISMPSAGTTVPFATGIANPMVVQIPCYGDLLFGAYSSGSPDFKITGITDSLGAPWMQYGPGITNFSNADRQHDDTCQGWYTPGHSAGDTCTITITMNQNTANDGTIIVYDIIGASPTQNAPERYATATGHQGVASSTIDTTVITPVRANGLILGWVQQEFNTEIGITTTGMLFDSCTFDGENEDGPQNMDQNGGWSHGYNTDLSAFAATWTLVNGSSNPMQEWASYAVSLVPPPPTKIYRRLPHSQLIGD